MSPTEDAVKAASTVDMPVLEGLRLALGSLKDPQRPWSFGNWTQCTCGHIYAGAHGGKMANREATVGAFGGWVISSRSRYGKMLRAIVDANGIETLQHYPITFAVSGATQALAQKRSRKTCPSERSERNAAIVLVERAVEHLEAQQREAMQVAKAGA